MHSNHTTRSSDELPPTDHRFACAGCDALTAQQGCATIRFRRGYAFACHYCAGRAAMSPRFKREIEMAALAGVTHSEAARVFAGLGCDVPTTPAEFDAALRLPPGTVAALFGGA